MTSPWQLQADESVDQERKGFCRESMDYVLMLQEVQERKKFEFVELVGIPPGYYLDFLLASNWSEHSFYNYAEECSLFLITDSYLLYFFMP